MIISYRLTHGLSYQACIEDSSPYMVFPIA